MQGSTIATQKVMLVDVFLLSETASLVNENILTEWPNCCTSVSVSHKYISKRRFSIWSFQFTCQSSKLFVPATGFASNRV